jgi:hypothetical protein
MLKHALAAGSLAAFSLVVPAVMSAQPAGATITNQEVRSVSEGHPCHHGAYGYHGRHCHHGHPYGHHHWHHGHHGHHGYGGYR